MNAIQFGMLLNRLTIWGLRELHNYEMIELHEMVKPDPVIERKVVEPVDLLEIINTLKPIVRGEREGRLIPAIKAVRQVTNLGLKEVKEFIEKYYYN